MKNPFVNDPRFRLELSYKLVNSGISSLLDYGCSDGRFLFAIKKKIPKAKLYGIEVDKEKIRLSKKKIPKAIILSKVTKYLKDIDTITMLDVLEHVENEKKVIKQSSKILKKGGILMLSVPHKGLTELFDAGNIKFRFPELHRILYETVFHKNNYQKKYKGNEMIGDISKKKLLWHKHYSLIEIKKILHEYFTIKQIYYFGLFFPILSMLEQAWIWIFNKKPKIIRKLILADSRTNYGKLSFSIFVYAIKK